MNASTEGPASSAAPNRAAPGLPWLVADIGGTNARFGWVADVAHGVQHIKKLPTAKYAGPAHAAGTYLADLSRELGGGPLTPQRAALAVATPIEGDEVEMTNSAWRFSRRALAQTLGVHKLLLLNDFEALALSLPRLQGTQLRSFGPLPAQQQGTLAVIGPGTGLGVAGLVQTAQGWIALPGEGGHATLAARDDYESRILQRVRHTNDHVSAERLLSGTGLPMLYEAVATVLGHSVPALDTKTIVERGVSGSDALCRHTIDTFCALLGSFAGNVALTFGARGGVYIGGGIVPRFGERFFASEFRARFEAKGRFQRYLQAIPTALITDTLAALKGAAFALEQQGG